MTPVNKDHLIRGYLGEMLAAEKYLFELVDAQSQADLIIRYPEAGPAIEPLRSTLEQHIERLDRHLGELGGAPASGSIKQGASVIAGKIEAVFEKMRSETGSRMLRDTYTALSLVTISYTMLHSSALAMGDEPTAEIALSHLFDLTPFVVSLSKVVPYVVVNELDQEYDGVDPTVAAMASNQTHEAWSKVGSEAQAATA